MLLMVEKAIRVGICQKIRTNTWRLWQKYRIVISSILAYG